MEARFFYEEELVRLHVLADSNTDEAQWIKMCVVQAIRHKAARIVRHAGSAREAFEKLEKSKEKLLRAARDEARRQGYAGSVQVETGRFDFPDRDYAGHTVPAGVYRAVRVKLGSGNGKNWWCVLYPQLCAVDQACAQALSGPEAVNFFSSIGRMLHDLLKAVGL